MRILFCLYFIFLWKTEGYVINPEKTFPLECEKHFAYTVSCPNLDEEYTKARNLCCGTQTNLTFICFERDVGNKYQIIKDCTTWGKEMVIPKGYHIDIEKHNGVFKIKNRPCDKAHYEPEDRTADQVRFNYCTKVKTTCHNEGQQTFCRGGTTGDDQCACKEGYKPKNRQRMCNTAFKSNACTCEYRPCAPGTKRRMLSNTQQCNGKMYIDYTCYKETTTNTNNTDHTTTSNAAPTVQQNYLVFALVLALKLMMYLFRC